jgi:TonB family protein
MRGAAVAIAFLSLAGSSVAASTPKSWVFVNPQYIITAEPAGPRSFVLNVVNLSEFVIVIQPNEFIFRGASGQFYIGQVYDVERKDGKGESYRYSASMLIKGRSFTGLTIIGAFREQEQIEELSLRIGARRYYMQAVERTDLDQLANKIGDLDLKNPDSRVSLEAANIPEVGSVKSTDGTSDWDRDWVGLLTPNGENPPKVVERPEIPLTDDARKAKVAGRARLSATITKNGTLLDLKVEKGIGHGMDDRIVQAIKNSWVFLPATRNGEIVEATVRFDVDVPARPQPPPAAKP